jgi:acyl-CoA reductase-like NAD-dependent aldehyde dehydrogenase
MEPDVTIEQLPDTQAIIYRSQKSTGKVALLLGAGNAASINPMDILYKLFVEDQVVLFKAHPVSAYLGPLLEESFHALIEPGYLCITYGGATEGKYLCQHPGIDQIHLTGSDKTFETIVFGSELQGVVRKAAHQPLLMKRVTAELGNVSPVIVVPGPWSASDVAYQAEHIVSMLTNNAGFNCNTTRVIIQHTNWPQRPQLIEQVKRELASIPLRYAYYPGSQQRHRAFITAHPDAEQFGIPNEQQLPWTLITDVDPSNAEDICFTTEAFCSISAETALPAENIVEYIDRAVTFANERLWGTLSATIIVHPRSLKDPAVAAAVERAIANLRYGTVGLNYWAAIGFALATTTWGAFPGHDIYNIQSGQGMVHNALMFSRPQKSVVRASFRSLLKPIWFVSQYKLGRKVSPQLLRFEATPSLRRLPALLWSSLR